MFLLNVLCFLCGWHFFQLVSEIAVPSVRSFSVHFYCLSLLLWVRAQESQTLIVNQLSVSWNSFRAQTCQLSRTCGFRHSDAWLGAHTCPSIFLLPEADGAIANVMKMFNLNKACCPSSKISFSGCNVSVDLGLRIFHPYRIGHIISINWHEQMF